MLPNKPIELVYIFVAGDPSVGIQHMSYQADVWIDLDCLAEEDQLPHLEEIRQGFIALYSNIEGEAVRVSFDFEEDRLTELTRGWLNGHKAQVKHDQSN